ncbi:MAG TPA: hypothetical protein VG322_14725 [Candidatus Acidoferrales bacterium]|nr:hypothetical protein [Candidatus Acidoferrales bacterium]
MLFTFPASLAPGRGLMGYSGDNFQHAWFLWHFARAVTHLQNPFYTDLIYYPARVNLSWSTTDPLGGFLALPLSLGFGPVVAYNVSLVLQLGLAAFCARLLCLRICANQAAALIGGACFGFSPFLMAHALGHLSLVTAFPIPLYCIALDRLLTRDEPGWRDGALLGCAMLLTALAHYNYTVICALATLVVIAVDVAMRGAVVVRRTWRALAWGAATFLALFAPLLLMLVGNRADVPGPRPFDHVIQYSADVLGFLIPPWNHILFGRFTSNWDLSIFTAGYEGTVYVGPVILALAAIGVWKGRRALGRVQRRWAVIATAMGVCFYLLSLGPALRIFGHQTSVPGPAALLYRVPWLRFVSAPARFQVIVALSAAVLASLGVAYLMERWRARTEWQRAALAGAVSALLLADLLTIPFPASSTADPAWLGDASDGTPVACTIPRALQTGTVITFPLIHWPYSMKSTWMQVRDEGRYKLVDGYLSYSPERIWLDYWANPIVRSLLAIQGEFGAPVALEKDRDVAASALRELDASAIVIFDSPQQDAAVGYVHGLLEREGRREGSCVVFAARSDADSPAAR